MVVSCTPQNLLAWLTESKLMGLPPKDPLDDEDENEKENEQVEEDNDKDDEPAIIREPDE